MISRRVKVLVSTRNHPSMSVAGTKRTSYDVRYAPIAIMPRSAAK